MYKIYSIYLHLLQHITQMTNTRIKIEKNVKKQK